MRITLLILCFSSLGLCQIRYQEAPGHAFEGKVTPSTPLKVTVSITSPNPKVLKAVNPKYLGNPPASGMNVLIKAHVLVRDGRVAGNTYNFDRSMTPVDTELVNAVTIALSKWRFEKVDPVYIEMEFKFFVAPTSFSATGPYYH